MLARPARPFAATLLASAAIAVCALGAAGPAAAAIPSAIPTRAAATTAHSGVEDFAYRSLDVRMRLGTTSDGRATLHVQETWTALFPAADQNRGIVRGIPETYRGARIGPKDVRVTNGSGRTVPFTADDTTRDDLDYRVLSIDDDTFKHGPTTYQIDYDLQNVVVDPASGSQKLDEFYWDVLPGATPQTIGAMTAEIEVPTALARHYSGDQRCFVGAYGSTDSCTLTVARTSTGTVFRTRITDLPPRSDVTAVIGFRRGTFTQPFIASRTWPAIASAPVALALALIGLVAAIIVRRRGWRDAKGRGIVVPQYEPDPELGPRPAAGLVRIDSRRVLIAEILALAVGGAIRVVEQVDASGDDDLELELITPTLADGDPAWQSLRPALTALFSGGGAGDTVPLGTRSAARAKRLAALSTGAGLREHGYRVAEPDPRPRRRLRILGAALAVLAVIGFVVGAVTDILDPLHFVAFAALGIAGVVAFVLSSPRHALTVKGAEAKERLAGLEEFIRLAERDRIAFLQSVEGAERIDTADARSVLKLKERLLPWAAFFGLEKSWAKELARDYDAVGDPAWFSGSAAFNAALLTTTVSGLRGSPAFASPTSSGSGGSFSSGSGFSGGGFSGGGGGGGFSGGR